MDSIPQQLLLQVILIFLNAFFAATEIAVISLNSAKLRKDAEGGDKTAKRLVKMVDEPAGFLSTIQIGITLAGFLGSAFAADNFSQYLVDWIYKDLGFTTMSLETLDVIAVIVITIILSYLTLVFGELVPKRVAMQKPYEIAKFTSPVVIAVSVVMKPVVMFLSLSTNVILKLLRMKTETEDDSVTEEEIKLMIELGGRTGAIETSESDWIKNVFDFNDIAIAEVMTQRSDIVWINIDDDEEKVLNTIKESGCSRIPVYGKDDDDVLGILFSKDFLMADGNRSDLKQFMRTAYFVSENMKASELFKKMQIEKIHLAIVIDEYGSVNGIVTMEDLLEEIVGNIYDEYDKPEEEDIKVLSEGVWKVQGDCSIKKFEAVTGIKIVKSGHYHTMGGVVLENIDSVPKDGEKVTVELENMKIQVVEVENRRIVEMIVKKFNVKTEEE